MREGKDVSLFACGIMVAMALEAAENLGKENISAEVINLHTIKPIDQKLVIKSASKTGAVVTCEEHSIIGGLGSAVSEILAENYPAPIKRIGVKDTFGESGNPKDLLVKYGLTSQEIVKAAKSVIARKI